MCGSAKRTHPECAARDGHVVEMHSDENPDVYRLLAALVRHRAATKRAEAGERKLSGGRPPPRAMGRQVAFLPRDDVLDGFQFQPQQLAWANLDHRELLRMESIRAIWIQERSRCAGRQDHPSPVEGPRDQWLAERVLPSRYRSSAESQGIHRLESSCPRNDLRAFVADDMEVKIFNELAISTMWMETDGMVKKSSP